MRTTLIALLIASTSFAATGCATDDSTSGDAPQELTNSDGKADGGAGIQFALSPEKKVAEFFFECNENVSCDYDVGLRLWPSPSDERVMLDYFAAHPEVVEIPVARLDVLRPDGYCDNEGEQIPGTYDTPRGFCEEGVRQMVDASATYSLTTYLDTDGDVDQLRIRRLMHDDAIGHGGARAFRTVRVERLDYPAELPAKNYYYTSASWE